jgi:hypothetical protein
MAQSYNYFVFPSSVFENSVLLSVKFLSIHSSLIMSYPWLCHLRFWHQITKNIMVINGRAIYKQTHFCIQNLDTKNFQSTKISKNVMSLIFFSELITAIVMQFTHFTGTSFTKLKLFLHQVSFIINTLFPLMRETLYAGRVKLSADASELFTQMCFSSSSSAKRHPRRSFFREPKWWKSEGAK